MCVCVCVCVYEDIGGIKIYPVESTQCDQLSKRLYLSTCGNVPTSAFSGQTRLVIRCRAADER